MKINSVLWPLFITLCLVAATIARAQDAWREIILSNKGEPIPTLKAIAIPATAECNGQNVKAFVLLWGHEKMEGIGYPMMGVIIENLREIIPPSELDQFEGPDLPDAVLRGKTMDISVVCKKTTKLISTRVILSGGWILPADVRGNERDFFDTNVRSTQKETAAWKQFIVNLSSGFDEGHLTIGGRVFSHKLNVKFSGKGIEPLLKELMEFTGP
jgi:hypothetical protein